MKRIIFLVLVLIVILSGVALCKDGAEEEKPAFVTYSYFTDDIGSGGISAPQQVNIIDSFSGEHFLVYALILAEGEHDLHIELKDSDEDIFFEIGLGEEDLEIITKMTYSINFVDTPESDFYVYELYDRYNGKQHLIDRVVVLSDAFFD